MLSARHEKEVFTLRRTPLCGGRGRCLPWVLLRGRGSRRGCRCCRCSVGPAAAKRLVQLDLVEQLRQTHAHGGLLQREQGALCIQQVQVAGHAVAVAQVGQLQACLLGFELGALGHDLVTQRALAVQCSASETSRKALWMDFSYWAMATSRSTLAAARLAELRPASKMGRRADGARVKPQLPLLNRPDSSLLAVPNCPVSVMRGKKAARAAPMLALALISCCSAWRMSGRCVSRSEGRPAGTAGRSAVSRSPWLEPRLASTSAGSAWPSKSTRAFSSRARWRCCCASVARAASVSETAWR